MADTTTDKRDLTREEAARYLRSVADGLASGDGRIGVAVGNKEVELSPPETITLETTVTERSRRIRKDVEALSLEFEWNPARDTVSSDADAEADAEPNS